MEKVKLGVIGCGTTSEVYINNLVNLFKNTEVAAVADISRERLDITMKRFGIARGYLDYHELLRLDDIEIVVNLTTPEVHAMINIDALNAGKHVYVEKPLAVTLEDAMKVAECARKNGRYVTCAPETILGMGTQAAKKIIDDGGIGYTTGATAFLLYGGSETWHPNPAFLYKLGAGPMMDAGPYYISALCSLFGPVERVSAMTAITFPERTITSQPLYGQKIKVEVPTHVSGNLKFKNGQCVTMILSYDVSSTRRPFEIEVYGSEGTVTIPFPGDFGGEVFYKRTGDADWTSVKSGFCYVEESRGLGVSDLASALLHKREPRLGMELGCHVLEVMQALYTSADTGRECVIKSSFTPMKPMPESLALGEID